MSQIQGSIKLTAKLIAAYLLLKVSAKSNYEYNYNYLNPLAITNVPTIYGFPFLPYGSCPELEWVVKVVFRLAITVVNNYLYNTPSVATPEKIKEWINEFTRLENNLEASGDNWLKLGNVLSDLIDLLNKIGITFNIEAEFQKSVQLESSETVEAGFYSLIEKEFQDFDNQIAEIIKQNPDLKGLKASSQGDAIDSLKEIIESTAFKDLDNTIVEHIKKNPYLYLKAAYSEAFVIDSLKEIIKYTAKLTQLADTKYSSGAFSESYPSLDDYDKLFQIIEKPAISEKFKEDKIFAYLQVAGSNPVVIEQFKSADSRLRITEKNYSDIANKFGVTDSLATALEEGRLYVADYALLDGLVNGNFLSKDIQQQKYVFAPVALFAVPPKSSSNRDLFPVAISYQQPSVSYQWIMFTPLNADDKNGEPWMTAKNIVEMADCHYQALISHLGRAHLVAEAFVVPTNNLPDQHPLKNLLLPHLEGTAFINYGAHQVLVAPGGTVDSLLGSTITADQSLAAKAAQSYLFNFNHISFPETLKSRRVDDRDKLPNYPYRDDGKLIWEAIKNWVNSYFKIYYETDSSVLHDKALQTWASTLTSFEGGRLQNFGDNGEGQIKTQDYLVQAVSTIIFTASAQHAAVNYPQKDFMMYSPALPFARYLPAPTNTQDTESFINGLPPLSQAQGQISLLYLLGSVYHTNLGNYSSLVDSQKKKDFKKVEDALTVFKQELKTVTDTINERNEKEPKKSPPRLIPYKFLLPAKIPQSINI